MADSKFPWELLKAESLRIVCHDLGAGAVKLKRKDEMVVFLRKVEEQGLEDVLENENENTPRRKHIAAAALPTTPKRKSEAIASDYNTRYRGKRARVSDPGPGASRHQAWWVIKKGGVNNSTASQERQAKELWTSHRQQKPRGGLKGTATRARRREVFDGIVLQKLPKPHITRDSSKNKEEDGPQVDVEGSSSFGINVGAAGVSDNVEDVGPDVTEVSSLSGSNKENESLSEGHKDGQAQLMVGDVGRASTGNILRAQAVVTAAENEDNDMDVEGEMITETEVVAEKYLPDVTEGGIGELTSEDVSHIEELLKSVVKDGYAI